MKKSILALAICAITLTGCGIVSKQGAAEAINKGLIDGECHYYADAFATNGRDYARRYSICIETKKMKAIQALSAYLTQ